MVNERFKNFEALYQNFRHSFRKHSLVFRAVAVIVHLSLTTMWQLTDYAGDIEDYMGEYKQMLQKIAQVNQLGCQIEQLELQIWVHDRQQFLDQEGIIQQQHQGPKQHQQMHY